MLVSTSGNQRYVFASNKLREAVGASHLLTLSTTDWVYDVLPDSAVILQESSGTTLVQVRDQAAAQSVAHALTSRALRQAPELDISVVSVDVTNGEVTSADVDRVFAEAHRNRSQHPSGAGRFPRMPAAAACASTDLPARAWHSDVRPELNGYFRNDYPDGEQPLPLSAEVIAKRLARPAAVSRMKHLLADHECTRGVELIDVDYYVESVEWSAVIHADGNRLGELFQTAIDRLDPGGVRELGEAVNEVAKESFCDAVAKLAELTRQRDELPIVPLIIGGDDLTMLVEGEYCLDVVHEYLTAFSQRAAVKKPIVQALHVAGRPPLTVSAGVAIVKPHFPFSVAYRLSQELCQSAKRVAAEHPGCHGLDMHVLLDPVITSLDAIRTGYRAGDVDLTQRPHLLPAGDQSVPQQRDWRAQLHALREELLKEADQHD